MTLTQLLSAVIVAVAPASGHAGLVTPVDLSSGSAGFFNTPGAGGFIDVYTLTLAAPGIFSASLTSAVGGPQDVDFSSIALSGPSGLYEMTQLLSDPFETWGLTTGELGAGSYSLTLTGTNSAAVGSYGGSMAVTPAIGNVLKSSVLTPLAALGSLDLSSGSSGFANTPGAGAFVDTLFFTLASRSMFTGSVTSAISGKQNVDFTSITIDGPSGSFSMRNELPDSYETWVLPSVLLNGGAYTARFAGTNSAAIGSYGGNFAVSPAGGGGPSTPVPEPGTAVLAMTALGVLVWVRRRRS